MLLLSNHFPLTSRGLLLPGCHGPADSRRCVKAGRDSLFSVGPHQRRTPGQVKAEASRDGSSSSEFYLNDYVEAKVMKLVDTDNALPIFIGLPESDALMRELGGQKSIRPMTYDLLKSTIEALGFKVSKVCVTHLLANTYYARVHYTRGGGDTKVTEIDVDARPSDAINLAVRCGAPIYIAKEVATKMADKVASVQMKDKPEARKDIVTSCRAALSDYEDPTTFLKLDLQIAIAEENYEKAIRIRSQIEDLFRQDRGIALVVALDTALADERYEEAQFLRDELVLLNEQRRAEKRDVEIAHDAVSQDGVNLPDLLPGQ